MSDSESPRFLAALGHRDFRLFVLMRVLFLVGQQMQTVAVGWQIYDLTRRPIDLGYVGLALFLPQILFALPAGQVADRMDRRHAILFATSVTILCPLALLALPRLGVRTTEPVYALLFLYGIGRTFLLPAVQAMLPRLVPIAEFSNAMSWRSSTGQAAIVGGPALGGFLFAAIGDWVFAAVAAATLGSWLIALAIRTPTAPEGGARAGGIGELLAGIAFVRAHPILLGAISLDLFAVLFGGATALLPIYARDILAIGPLGLGLLRSAPALGSVVCGLWLAAYPLRRHAGRTMFLCVAGYGLAIVVFGVSRNLYLSLTALAASGMCDMVSVFVRQTLIQLGTPDAMRGRVNAVSLVFIGASNELGEFESGMTAAWFGTVPSVVVGGVGTLVVVALWAWRFAGLRKVDRLRDHIAA